MREEKSSNIHWHPAFVEAIKMELKEYLDKIEILPEVPLTAEPLKIDCIIIKKTKNLVIKKNIARLFRDWNIIEYKNPQDHVSVNDFHKVYAYACLYSVINNAPVDSMTVSFIESRYPKKLIGFLEKVRNYKVEKTSPGIYTVKGDVFAIQIIDMRRLSDDENLWLKSLRGNLDANAMGKVITEINKQDKAVSLGAYFDVISRVNTGLLKETMTMKRKKKREESLSLKEIIMTTELGQEWIKEWQAKAKAEGKAEAKSEKTKALFTVARNLKSGGMSNKLISQYTGLSLAKINKAVKIS